MDKRWFLLLGIGLLCVYSCNTTARLLCKDWQVNDVKYTRTGPLNQAEREQLRFKLTREFQFRFRPDSFYYVVQGTDTAPGKWWLSADKKQIITVTGTDTSQSEILTLNSKVFSFRPLNTLNNIDQLICYPATK